jgi:hypothetical protein
MELQFLFEETLLRRRDDGDDPRFGAGASTATPTSTKPFAMHA